MEELKSQLCIINSRLPIEMKMKESSTPYLRVLFSNITKPISYHWPLFVTPEDIKRPLIFRGCREKPVALNRFSLSSCRVRQYRLTNQIMFFYVKNQSTSCKWIAQTAPGKISEFPRPNFFRWNLFEWTCMRHKFMLQNDLTVLV